MPNRISGELSIPGAPSPPPKVRISFRLDVGWDGGRWDGATKGEGGEFRGGEEMRKEGGGGGEGENAKRSWPGRSPRFTNYSISPAN